MTVLWRWPTSCGAEVDLTALAMRLPEPLAIQLPPRSMWRAVTDVAPGACLIIPAGRAAPRHVRWHTPPAPVRTAADGAAAVREALAAAVTVRTERDGLLSADLSGGLDSTSLCSFAAGQLGAGELIVGGIPGDETISDDAHYARLAAAHWPHVEHVELTPQQTPLFYRGIVDDGCRTDIPAGVAMSRDRATAVISLMARRGSRLHMTGHGGDHLFFQSGAYCHDLIARRPLLAWQRIRGYRTLYGWRWRPVLRQLADRRSYGRAVAGMDLKTPGDLDFCTPQLAWVLPPVVQPWLTAECRELVTVGLREAAERAEPYAPTLGRHRELSALYTGTQECAAIVESGRRAACPRHDAVLRRRGRRRRSVGAARGPDRPLAVQARPQGGGTRRPPRGVPGSGHQVRRHHRRGQPASTGTATRSGRCGRTAPWPRPDSLTPNPSPV